MMYGFGGGYGPGPGFLGGGWLIMGIGMFVAVGLLVWLVVSVARREHPAAFASHGCAAVAPPQSALAPDPALAIARERYARGEIDAAQYEEIVTRLGGS